MIRRLPLVLALLLLAPFVEAQEPESITQMSLASSQRFITRLEYNMVKVAVVVLVEAAPPTCATVRKSYAGRVIQASRQSAANAAPTVVGGVNLIGTVISTPDGPDTSATDAAIFSQVSTFWNALAGCTE